MRHHGSARRGAENQHAKRKILLFVRPTGDGESDNGKLDAWFKTDQADLAKLEEYWNIT